MRIAAYAVACVLVLLGCVRYLGGGEAEPSTPPAEVTLDGVESGGGEADERGAGSSGELFVHVAGAVRKEGLYRVPSGARVGAAVKRAGGLESRAELSGVNLAAQVQDGQQIVVPERGAAPPGQTAAVGSGAPGSAASSTSTPGATAAPISLASATPEQLDAGVEGIGPTLAARIVEFRDQNGGFQSVDQLREVDGIGEARFAALREAVSP